MSRTPAERAAYITALCDQIGAATDAHDMPAVRAGLDELMAAEPEIGAEIIEQLTLVGLQRLTGLSEATGDQAQEEG